MFEHHTAQLVERELIEVHAYVLMDNHFHLLVRSQAGELSAAMHRLGSGYAGWYNRRHRRDGALFRNRFVSVPVRSDGQLLVVSRYIHRNPLAFVPPDALGAYRWSSLGAYLRRRPAPEWLTIGMIDDMIGGPERHRAFVAEAHPADGDHQRWAPFRGAIDSHELEEAIGSVVCSDPTLTGRAGHRGWPDPFVLLVTLAVELRVEPAEHLAGRYGLPSPAAVRALARRGRVRLAADPGFARLRSRALAVLGERMAA